MSKRTEFIMSIYQIDLICEKNLSHFKIYAIVYLKLFVINEKIRHLKAMNCFFKKAINSEE